MLSHGVGSCVLKPTCRANKALADSVVPTPHSIILGDKSIPCPTPTAKITNQVYPVLLTGNRFELFVQYKVRPPISCLSKTYIHIHCAYS